MEKRNNKLSKKVIILLCCFVIVLIGIISFIVINNYQNSSSNNENPTLEDFYLEESMSKDNNSEDSTAKKNEPNNASNDIEKNYTPEDRKAVELAKQKFENEESGVTFSIVDHDNEIYHISVNDSQTTEVIAWYEVNIKSGEVSDY